MAVTVAIPGDLPTSAPLIISRIAELLVAKLQTPADGLLGILICGAVVPRVNFRFGNSSIIAETLTEIVV